MQRDVAIAAAQFEARDADKAYNLGRIEALAQSARQRGAEVVSFHECSICGYTFLQTLSREELFDLAEPVPAGPSTRRLVELAGDLKLAILAGLIERDGDAAYKSYVVVTPQGYLTKFHKLHPFIHPQLTPGAGYVLFDLCGIRCSILICYDNNLVENPRMAALLGAELVFAPHVTGGLPSPMPGRGTIDRALWDARERDPVPLRLEFEGPKGRGWLMRWLPARAFENGLYYVYSNAVGVDHDTIKPGGAMILDPLGEIVAESRALGDDVVVGLCTPDKLAIASGRRYIKARRPDLYAKLSEPLPPGQKPETTPGWKFMRGT